MPYLTKIYKFCAAHRYWNENWSDKKNIEVFGDDVKIHGHNYILEITVNGAIDNSSGFIIDLKKLSDVVNLHVINILDHSQIEKDIDWFSDKQPSTENLVRFIWKQISDKIPGSARLYKIMLQETPTIYTEYFGEDE